MFFEISRVWSFKSFSELKSDNLIKQIIIDPKGPYIKDVRERQGGRVSEKE